MISDKGGAILGSDNGLAEFRTFDAFGKARDNQGLDNLGGRLFANNPNGKRNRKGFTGHEHLDEAGLIHMNGRAYGHTLLWKSLLPGILALNRKPNGERGAFAEGTVHFDVPAMPLHYSIRHRKP